MRTGGHRARQPGVRTRGAEVTSPGPSLPWNPSFVLGPDMERREAGRTGTSPDPFSVTVAGGGGISSQPQSRADSAVHMLNTKHSAIRTEQNVTGKYRCSPLFFLFFFLIAGNLCSPEREVKDKKKHFEPATPPA